MASPESLQNIMLQGSTGSIKPLDRWIQSPVYGVIMFHYVKWNTLLNFSVLY